MNTKRIVLSIVFLICFGVFLTVFNNFEKTELSNTNGKSYAMCRVDKVLSNDVQGGGQIVRLEVLSGRFKGETTEAKVHTGYLYGVHCTENMKVHTVIYESDRGKTVSVTGSYRINAVIAIILIFFATIIFIGGRKGLMSVLGLIFTFITILWLYLPMIYRGFSPFLAAVAAVSLTTAVCIPLIGGFTRKSLAAACATVTGVVFSGIIASLFGKMASVTGYNVQEIDELVYIAGNTDIQIGGLLFSGILIASLGAVMDVGMSVASAVDEIYSKSSFLTRWELFKSGMNVGRDMMGTMSNTLILAFAGNSVNTLVILYAYNYPAIYTMNLYSTCIEIIRGISGSMAVILTVPVAAMLSAVLCCDSKKKERV